MHFSLICTQWSFKALLSRCWRLVLPLGAAECGHARVGGTSKPVYCHIWGAHGVNLVVTPDNSEHQNTAICWPLGYSNTRAISWCQSTAGHQWSYRRFVFFLPRGQKENKCFEMMAGGRRTEQRKAGIGRLPTGREGDGWLITWICLPGLCTRAGNRRWPCLAVWPPGNPGIVEREAPQVPSDRWLMRNFQRCCWD